MSRLTVVPAFGRSHPRCDLGPRTRRAAPADSTASARPASPAVRCSRTSTSGKSTRPRPQHSGDEFPTLRRCLNAPVGRSARGRMNVHRSDPDAAALGSLEREPEVGPGRVDGIEADHPRPDDRREASSPASPTTATGQTDRPVTCPTTGAMPVAAALGRPDPAR